MGELFMYRTIDEKIAALEARIASMSNTDERLPGLNLALAILYAEKANGGNK